LMLKGPSNRILSVFRVSFPELSAGDIWRQEGSGGMTLCIG
jgi:hypothetical protein